MPRRHKKPLPRIALSASEISASVGVPYKYAKAAIESAALGPVHVLSPRFKRFLVRDVERWIENWSVQ